MHLLEEIKRRKNVSGAKGIPPEGEEPTTRSPSVTSTNVPSMDPATMDMDVQDMVLSSRATVKVPSNLMEKTLETC